ncbi:MAG: Ppx/GppA family phosphatase [Ignavibacteria bacterium]|nr:Ppx/GppA family phosphatase [Ignavibacteria bacterium]
MIENIAAIDIGTNSFHLVIAKIDSKNRFKILTKSKEVVRLGDSSNDMKYISAESVERGVDVLKRFKLICESYHAEIIAVATSATREALNQNEFKSRVFEETGIEINVVSGYEEARLIYLGILQSLEIFDRKILLIDIGGGSTEFLVGHSGEVKYANSVKIGAVRLTKKFSLDKRSEKNKIKDSRIFTRNIINQVVRALENEDYEMVIGSSGTILSIAGIIKSENLNEDEAEANLNGFIIKKKPLLNAMEKIYDAETVSDRSRISGLDPKRYDIITAGSIILEQIFSELKIEKMTVSSYALREGIIMNYIQQNRSGDDFMNFKNVRFNSIIHLCELTNFEREHSYKVMENAKVIFDSVSKATALDSDDREFLEAACLMHDIGYHISPASHHKHSYYLIRNADLMGFNDKEIEIIANTARYHRKSFPKIKHDAFAKLDPESQIKVKKLSGILRIADALDRSHKGVIENFSVLLENKTVNINITSCTSDPSLELWGAEQRKQLFEESFGLKVNFNLKRNS